MSNQSILVIDQIASTALPITSVPWTSCFYYYPDHVASTIGPASNVVTQQDAAGTQGRKLFLWDFPDSSLAQAWLMLTGAGNIILPYQNPIPAARWSHLAVRWGFQENIGVTRQDLESYLDGIFSRSVASAAPSATASAQIALWHDVNTTNSALGQLAYYVTWQGIALSGGELAYAGNGGWPLNIRPSNPSVLVEFLPLITQAADVGPHAVTQTVTGTSFTASPPGLLPRALLPLQRTNNIVLVCHEGPPINEYFPFLAECTDGTGVNFEFRPIYYEPPAPNVMRDTSLYFQPTTGTWWLAGQNEPTNGVSSSWDLAQSVAGVSNGNEFSYVQSVDCSAVTGTGAGKRTWKPRPFTAVDGSVHYTVSLASNGDPFVYEMHPTTKGNLAGTWTAPVTLTGTAFAATTYDCQIFRYKGTYCIICVGWSNYPVEPSNLNVRILQSSGDYLGPYNTVLVDGQSVGWGSQAQGPSIFQNVDGTWNVNLDPGSIGIQYSKSSSGTLETATWTTPAPVLIHGLDYTQSGFVPQGGTLSRMLAGGGGGDVVGGSGGVTRGIVRGVVRSTIGNLE